MIELSTAPDYLQTLIAAAQSGKGDRPTPTAVIDALLAAEKAAKHDHSSYLVEPLLGQWQLCFATGTRKRKQGGITLGKGFYMPSFVQAQIGFDRPNPNSDDELLQISNQVQVGLMALQILGPARYLNRKNLLAFDFTQMQLKLLGKAIYQGSFRGGLAKTVAFAKQPIARLPFFRFFLVTETFIAARGRGGGLAMWTKSP